MSALHFDLSGLLAYSINNCRVSGVQRVELSILSYLIENDHHFIPANAFGIETSRLNSIIRNFIDCPETLLLTLKNECEFIQLSRNPIAHVKYALKRSYYQALLNSWLGLTTIAAGDTLFIAGSYWLHPDAMRFYQACARKNVRLAVLLHDLMPITHHDAVVKGSQTYFEGILRLPVSLITTTRSVEREIGDALNLIKGSRLPLSVQIVPLAHEFPGAARNSKSGTSTQRLRCMIRDRSFVVVAGTVEMRKNHRRLMEIWVKLAKELYPNLPLLIIAGKRGWGAEDTLNLLDAATARDKISANEPYLYVEEPSDEELQWLYASCHFTIFPSRTEGWGLPVGESLWFGKPCASSCATSLPEVGGDLCVYFDPVQEDEIINAIKTLLDPETHSFYRKKIEASPLRSWSDAGRDFAKAIGSTAADPG